MAINDTLHNVTSRHYLRIPTPDTGANDELYSTRVLLRLFERFMLA
jgi:hypothetical protein